MPRSPASVSIGIARDEPDQEEGQQGDSDEGRDDEADACQDESEHRAELKKGGAAVMTAPPKVEDEALTYLISTP